MSMINDRLSALREEMQKRKFDAYIIPTSDFHETEYVGDHFKARAYMSGFTGSSATLVVTMKEAALWTDGRYFIQAASQLKGSGIELMRMGEPNVPTLISYIEDHVPSKGILGFDGRVINTRLGVQLSHKLKQKDATICCDEDLVDLIWNDRPQLPKEKAFLLDVLYCGERAEDKLKKLREDMKEYGCDTHVITSLDDIAWLFNIRGNDIECYPVVLAFAMVTMDQAYLYVDKSKLSDEMIDGFQNINVTVMDYEDIYSAVEAIDESHRILLDSANVNYAIYNAIKHKNQIVDKPNPTQIRKACKNETELKNNVQAHIKDGVAVTKFMYWLKTNVGKMKITEISAADKLLSLRKEQEGFIEPSFDTISAYKEHAAMMHYSATEESDVEIKAEGMLLVDSGGQYYQGTTDITRTMAMGELNQELKTHFTAVLRSMINLAKAKFLYGCRGINLDILARGPIWDMDLDYRCGTGHGIGFVLNVHEAPNGFRWRIVPERNDSCVLEPGMVTSDEPGIYVEGSHGIRTENEIVVRKGEANEYGQFMHFETITYVPIDLDAINADQMNTVEKAWLNDYHKHVYETIAPHLNDDEKAWLKTYTRAI